MSNAEKWIFFPMETKARELESRLLLALFALKKGYTVVFAHHNTLRNYISYFPRGVYFYKDLSFYKRSLFKNLDKLGFKVVTLDEEGLAAARDQYGYAKQRFSEENLDIVDKVICWGMFDYGAMFPKYTKYGDKFLKLGSPRLDVWSSKVSAIFDEDVVKLQKMYGDFIFIPSNFSTRSNANNAKFHIQYAETKNIINSAEDHNKFVADYEYRDRGCGYFLDLIPRLAKKYPHLNFVIRNHPSESPAIWDNIARGLDNVFVEYKGSVTPYIKASKGILHFACTSGLEAYLLGIPSLIYCPEVDEKFDSTVSAKLSKVHRTYKDLVLDIDIIADIGQSYVCNNIVADQYFSDNFFNDKEKLSAEKIIDTIDSYQYCFVTQQENLALLEKLLKYIKVKQKIKHSFILRPIRFLYRYIRKIMGLVDPLTPSDEKKKQKWPGLFQKDIVFGLEKFARELNVQLDIECDNFSNEIYIVKRKVTN